MATGQDTTYSGQSKVYIKQQPAGSTINGNTVTTEEVTDVGGLQNRFGLNAVNNKVTADLVAFAIAAGAANHCVVTITVQDNGGQVIAGQPFHLDVCLSDALTGVGLTATTASGGIAFTTGTLLSTYVASKAAYVETDTNGVIVLNITDTAKTAFVISVQGSALPFSYQSRALVVGDYG